MSTGAEKYFAKRMTDPAYAQGYRDAMSLLEDDMMVAGKLLALEDQIATATNMSPSAWILPPEVLGDATSMYGVPVVRLFATKPGLVYRPLDGPTD